MARLVEGPEDVSKRDFVIGLVCVAVVIAVAIVYIAIMISHAPGAKAV
jgi:hypothetical protein